MAAKQGVRGLDQVSDVQTALSEGVGQEAIGGVVVRPALTHADELGTRAEVFDERWDFGAEPIVFVSIATIRPGQVRGWVVHFEQDNRLFFATGTAKLGLYDAREGSATFGLVNVFFLGSHARALVRIPVGVVHGIKNVGGDEVVFLDLPTRPYAHDDPDKYRFPLDGPIPYRL
jgi:dTDP-4-dehydrorhamnose 3,5-epimerase